MPRIIFDFGEVDVLDTAEFSDLAQGAIERAIESGRLKAVEGELAVDRVIHMPDWRDYQEARDEPA